jgi:hypothetical protein
MRANQSASKKHADYIKSSSRVIASRCLLAVEMSLATKTNITIQDLLSAPAHRSPLIISTLEMSPHKPC